MVNEGVGVHCKAVRSKVFTVVFLLVELGKAIEKSKGSLEAYHSISSPSVIVTSSYHVFLLP